MIEQLIVLILALLMLPVALVVAASLASARGAWRLARVLGRFAPYLIGSDYGGTLAFQSETAALRDEGRLAEATALVKARLLDPGVSAWNRNTAIDILISTGAYQAALRLNLLRRSRKTRAMPLAWS